MTLQRDIGMILGREMALNFIDYLKIRKELY